ncbi:tRNA(Met) cytidine acetyltransferase [Oceanisphaera litoralis]|uniref:tRNA(Met) cytidine acetyltransferase TmcA n=1 Tax=Oceanisphaera litoralis TaxID=225144 RepID=UPI0019579D3A|nr:GNAT family N-acetyltransferase [Oceanisphaera litoralis]MBM7454409.1 tRNA(Met) cytidine acetyltransferase [Oceanisphaera litoralis]
MTEWSHWRRQLRHNGERRLLVLSGNEDWAMTQARELAGRHGEARTLWLGQAPADQASCAIGKFQGALGREYDSLVFNAYSGLHPDAFGAAVGTLVAGGMLLLLCPPLREWPTYADPDLVRYVALPEQAAGLDSPFLHRFATLLQQDTAVLFWRQEAPFPPLPDLSPAPWRRERDRRGCLNPQQRHALMMLLHAARRRQPLVLTADRGRGKSSLLGLAAGRWLAAGYRVLLTAPSPGATAQALAHCDGPLDFIAPDTLLAQRPDADILLVDEAAAIPVPMLLTLARRYCCIFASTEHGYEGTGLGFQLKFQPALTTLAPDWQKVHLDMPARWSPQDPLEPLVFRLLALDADPITPPRKGELSMGWVSRQQFLDDDRLLQQLFGLLTLAHYQTRPSDLRHLLDAPELSLAVAFRAGIPVAAALLTREGTLAPTLAQAIWRGQRRPRGHLLPQSLSFHGGIEEACRFSYQRVMRIVVHPHCQQQGIGSQLLSWLQQGLQQGMQQDQCDFLGASFGASPELLDFWQNNGFAAVRIGLGTDGVSGLHAAMMLWPCSDAARQALPLWQGQFSANLAFYRRGLLRELPDTWWQHLKLPAPASTAARDSAIAHDFAFCHRDLLCDRPALVRFIQENAPLVPLSRHQQALLHALLTPGALPAEVARQQGLSGQKAVIQQCRQLLRHFFSAPSET